MKQVILLISLTIAMTIHCFAQETYKIGSTEYYYNEYYSTTGKPLVKRNEANKMEFLRSRGYDKVPDGYEVDHIIPLSEGGTDDPSNMQLLTKEQHAIKTARERANRSNSTYSSMPSYNSNTTQPSQFFFTPPSSTNNRIIHTGPRGGKYYINESGKKVYIKDQDTSPAPSTEIFPATNTTISNPNIIHTGPRGGKYYINSNGNKTYVR